MPTASLKYLEKISYNDATFMKETVEIFIENTPKELEKIKVEIKSRNLDSIGSIAHSLKSTLKMMDMQATYQLSLQLEKEAKGKGDTKTMVSLTTQIEKDCIVAYKELGKVIKAL